MTTSPIKSTEKSKTLVGDLHLNVACVSNEDW